MPDSRLDESVSLWIEQLKEGSEDAPERLWERYFQRLMHLARRRLEQVARRDKDEEDVALSAFHSFYEGVKEGRFPKLDNREDLWKVLVVITSRKAAGVRRAAGTAKRGKNLVRGESVFLPANKDVGDKGGGLHQFAGREPTPEFAAAIAEQCEVLLEKLGDPVLRQIALLKMEGSTNAEIASSLDVTERTVERKLERIRQKWAKEIDDDSELATPPKNPES